MQSSLEDFRLTIRTSVALSLYVCLRLLGNKERADATRHNTMYEVMMTAVASFCEK